MKKIIRLLIMLIAVILVVILYNSKYQLEPTIDTLTEPLATLLKEDVTIEQILPVDEDYMVGFTVKENNLSKVGFIKLRKGFNGKYIFADGSIGPGDNLLFENANMNGTEYLVSYGYIYNRDTLEVKGVEKSFQAPIINGYNIVMFDANMEVTDIESYNLSVGDMVDEVNKGDIDYRGNHLIGSQIMVLSGCFMILLAGLILSFVFTPKFNRLERLYMKITKSHMETDHIESDDIRLY